MSETQNSGASGIGFTGLLALVFVIFKLLGRITWSWWWVLSPLWISGLIAVAMIIFVVFMAAALAAFD